MRLLSKVFKASNIKFDDSSKYVIEVKNEPLPSKQEESFAEPADLDGDVDLLFDEYSRSSKVENIDSEHLKKIYDTIIEDAHVKAKQIIEKAQFESKDIFETTLADLEVEKNQILTEAKEQGFEEGFKKGELEAEGIKSQAMDLYNQALHEKEQLLENSEKQMIDLVLSLVEKLLSDSVSIHPKIILHLIKQGLSETTVTGEISIHVSPDDYEYVMESKEQLLSMISGAEKIEILKDFSLNSSDCIIETPFGNIDSSLEMQLEQLKEDIYYIYNHSKK